jgi:class 3 adenylate cyclase
MNTLIFLRTKEKPHLLQMFADIVGFNAWSSEREPHQIFQLLETLFGKFDIIAQQKGIVKVESNGDSYIAVAGLLETKSNHAITMAQFAFECKLTMSNVIKEMELILGPGTADLEIRFGLHSGPVIAGILHGIRQKFQLFGDTVNIASNLEATSTSGSIHVTQETATLIAIGGKKNWLSKRNDAVYIKGKGNQQVSESPTSTRAFASQKNSHAFDNAQTFWVIPEIESSQGMLLEQGSDKKCSTEFVPESRGAVPGFDSHSNILDLEASLTDIQFNEKRNRLIDWNVEVLSSYLTKIIHQRNEGKGQAHGSCRKVKLDDSLNILDEVSEIIIIPPLDRRIALRSENFTTTVSPEICFQLRVYVATIASLYLSKNAFHNFEHASHVLMSASKLMKRIVTNYDIDNARDEDERIELMEKHHLATFGISSDPLTQFAILFASLIHDVDHPGVSNSTLVDEESKLAKQFKGKSVAEQHSVAVAWNILMQEQFSELQRCIFLSNQERKRFRQLVVNCVMATDIMDRDLQDLRKRRWAKAFPPESSEIIPSMKEEALNRKATIVIEHIIQASDVAHTMQHWHVYTKWNELLFNEMYSAFLLGRSDNDPSLNWYESK